MDLDKLYRQICDHSWSLLTEERFTHLRQCIEDVVQRNVPGDLMETGVWRGGAVIWMRGILKALNVTDRRIWACDSFRGHPPREERERYDMDEPDLHRNTFFHVTLETVQEHFTQAGLLDAQTQFIPGYFLETMPTIPVEHLAVLRLDGDMYRSTMEVLEVMIPKVSPTGWVIIDDYQQPRCKAAVHDYLDRTGLPVTPIPLGEVCAYWQMPGV